MLRIDLIKAQPTHTQFIYDLYCKDQVMRGSGLHRPIHAKYWRDIITGLYETHQFNYVVTVSGVKAGFVAIQAMDRDDRRAEICIAIHPDMQQRGVGTQALSMLHEGISKTPQEGGLNLQCLLAYVVEDNLASRKLFEAAGYELVATIPDYYRFGSSRVARCVYSLKFN